MNGYKTEDFEAGSEFRVNWEVSRPNPRYNPIAARLSGKTSHREIITKFSSPIFSTYERAAEFIVEAYLGQSEPRIKVRRPGTKNFIPVYNAKGAA